MMNNTQTNATEQNIKIGLRSPLEVMSLKRMGCAHQNRLSFMRVLLRRLKKQKWTFRKTRWSIDDQGYGQAVYTVYGPDRSYSLVAFSHELADEQRSDRVIATAWDATFTLFDGVPQESDLQRLQNNVPKQEAGRISNNELSLSRANRSVRLWSHVVDQLAQGMQPDRDKVEAVGYLMRTTAVYGSGKFGTADRKKIADRDELHQPFQAEMLSVWLTRAFTLDLVEHIAAAKGGDHAVTIEPELRRRFGVGNSTGLGMAPFIMNHPVLINNWVLAREQAFVKVRSIEQALQVDIDRFKQKFLEARQNVEEWHSQHSIQQQKLADLKQDIGLIERYLECENLLQKFPWNRFFQWSTQELTTEGQELLLSLMLEPYAEMVDSLAETMDADEEQYLLINGTQTLSAVCDDIRKHCSWALSIDYQQQSNRACFWYTSAEKLEPRVGQRFEESGAELELPLATGFFINELLQDLEAETESLTLADFLMKHPQHRHAVRRLQILKSHPYAEVCDNLLAVTMLPIDLLRFKLAFFGATKFDPRSDRWVRICMYQDVPFPHELLESHHG